jgi:hypothetical protein
MNIIDLVGRFMQRDSGLDLLLEGTSGLFVLLDLQILILDL